MKLRALIIGTLSVISFHAFAETALICKGQSTPQKTYSAFIDYYYPFLGSVTARVYTYDSMTGQSTTIAEGESVHWTSTSSQEGYAYSGSDFTLETWTSATGQRLGKLELSQDHDTVTVQMICHAP